MSWDDWVRGVEIEPSIYAGDFSRLGEQLTTLLDAGVRIFHFDAGDGHFIEPITIGPIVVTDVPALVNATPLSEPLLGMRLLERLSAVEIKNGKLTLRR